MTGDSGIHDAGAVMLQQQLTLWQQWVYITHIYGMIIDKAAAGAADDKYPRQTGQRQSQVPAALGDVVPVPAAAPAPDKQGQDCQIELSQYDGKLIKRSF